MLVLMHDTAGKELTAQTLPQIIEYLKTKATPLKTRESLTTVPLELFLLQ